MRRRPSDRADLLSGLAGRPRDLVGEFPNLGGNHREAAAGLTRAGGLDRGADSATRFALPLADAKTGGRYGLISIGVPTSTRA